MSAADDLLAEFFVHTATVETYLGKPANGDAELFDTPFLLDPATTGGCFIEGVRHLVRDGAGETVTSGSTLYCHPDHAHRFAPRSRVTLRDGLIRTRVITLNINDLSDDYPEHVAVQLE